MIGLSGILLIGAVSPQAQPGSRVETLLRQTIGFSADDLEALASGSAVIKSLKTPVRQEIAHVGAVYIDAPAERFLERFRNIERFESGPGIPQIGRFGSPPQLDDLDPLTLPAADIDVLSACRPGDCDVQLAAAAIERFRTQVRWSAPDAAQQANAIAREVLLALVREYQAGGNAALGQYNDGGEPLPVAAQFRALLASSDDLPVPMPDLLAYLDSYPYGRPAGAEEFFYWAVVDFGLKPTVRVNHVVIHPLTSAPVPGQAYAIAIKQLYASHYFHTTLEIRFLLDDDRPGRHGSWLISITRSRNDGMTGFRGIFLGPIISGRSSDAVRGYLEHVKRQVERPVPVSRQ